MEPMNGASQQSPYRWVVVFAAAVILALSMGAIGNGMSAFIKFEIYKLKIKVLKWKIMKKQP